MMSNHLGDAPPFPPVAAELLTDAPRGDLVSDFLAHADAWRRATLAWLAGPECAGHLSGGLTEFLAAALGESAALGPELEARRVSRYPLPNPAATDGAAEHRRALDVLVWRSRLASFLADAWDTMGPPIFELEECDLTISALLISRSSAMECIDCLQPLLAHDQDAQHAHFFQCVVRLRRDRPPSEGA
jgi:hypothetical protein